MRPVYNSGSDIQHRLSNNVAIQGSAELHTMFLDTPKSVKMILMNRTIF